MEKKRPLIKRIFDYKMLLHDFVVATGLLPTWLFFRHKFIYVNGKKPKRLFRGSYIISSNHNTLLDPIIVCEAFWFRRVGFVCTKDLFDKSKLLAFLLRKYGVVSVDKSDPSLKIFKDSEKHINRGHIMCFFPEGMVVREEEMGTFKSGIIMLSIMTGADILPIYLVKREKYIKRQRVLVGEKIKVSDYLSGPFPSIEEVNKVTALLKEKEQELIDKYNLLLKEKKKW